LVHCSTADTAEKQPLHQTASCALIIIDNPLTYKISDQWGPNKGDAIVKFQSFISFAFALAASLLLAACGGGGAVGNPNQGGPISASPAVGTFYAGEPATITLSGGRKPYAITSSEPGILPVPAIVNANSFEVVPNNPGVVDTGLGPNDLPVRTVTVEVRDTTGIIVSITIKVAQNFVTGYRLAFVATTCPAPVGGATTTAITPCAGSDTAVHLSATTNGSLHGNEAFELSVVRGQFSFYTPDSSTSIISQVVNVTSDHEGKITAVIRVPAGVPSQIGIIRVKHIGTGASQEQVFTIQGASTTPLTLTAIPSTFTFTGATDASSCGTGVGDFYVFDGAPPYAAVSTTSGVQVTPASSSTQPGRFTVAVGSGQSCPTAAPVIVTDSLGNRVVVTVTAVRGAAAAAPPALAVAPAAIVLACGTSGSVSVVGGSNIYSASSSHPGITATVSGHTVTITRTTGDLLPGYPVTGTISITDGASVVSVTATVPSAC
jgi:hypothetical protein